MIFKVDIDNVIRDITAELVKIYNEKFCTDLKSDDVTYYDVRESFPLLKENGINAVDFFFKDNCSRVFGESKAMPGSVEGLSKLRALGHKIILVTYQPNDLGKIQTVDWLRDNNIPYDGILFTNEEDKTVIDTDVIIDDNPKFLDMDRAMKVCVDWNYNKHTKCDYRVGSINEFVDKFFATAN